MDVWMYLSLQTYLSTHPSIHSIPFHRKGRTTRKQEKKKSSLTKSPISTATPATPALSPRLQIRKE